MTTENQTVETKTYSINELMNINNILAKCKNDKEVKNSSTILTGIRVSRQIQKIVKEFFEEREEIFKSFEIEKTVDEQKGIAFYDYENHKEKSKIDQALKEANDTKFEIKGMNAITEEDFVFYTRGLENDEIVFLYGYLVKE